MPTSQKTTRKKARRDAEKNAITLLEDDHERVRRLLAELERTTEKTATRREKLLATIEQELRVHTKIEEDVFYPAFFDAARTGDDKELYYEAVEEHHVVDLVLPEIKGTDPKGGPFAAKAKVLKDLVEHHAEEEEKEMFPRARKLMDRERLIELGEPLAKARETARTSFLERVAGMIRPSTACTTASTRPNATIVSAKSRCTSRSSVTSARTATAAPRPARTVSTVDSALCWS